MKQLLTILLVLASLCLLGCNRTETVTHRDVLFFAPVVHDQRNMQRVVDALKSNTVFYQVEGKCFAAIFYWTGDNYNSVSFTQVDKCPRQD